MSSGSSFQISIAVKKKHDLVTGPGLFTVCRSLMLFGLFDCDLVVLVFPMSRSVF